MPRYSKKVVDLANGGIFAKVIAKRFNFKQAAKAGDEAAAKLGRQLDDVLAKAKHTAKGSKRDAYVGSTPSRYSNVGKQTLATMDSSLVKNRPKGDPSTWTRDQLDRVKVKGSDGKWYDYADTNMGHSPIDAVSYWNNVGRFHGPRSQPVRDWMNDPANYQIQPGVLNQADGRIMGRSGFTYQPPVTLPDGINIRDVEREILDELKDFKGNPIPD